LNGGKLRAGAANPKRYNPAFNAIKREAAACTNNAAPALQTGIERAVNEVLDFSVAVKVFWVYS
jgi:hypothetical protein